MNKAMFSDAKVGQKVWSIELGRGSIDRTNHNATYPINVLFDSGSSVSYTKEGKRHEGHINPTLFWDKVTIVPPERPKEHRCKWWPIPAEERCRCGKVRSPENPEKHKHNFMSIYTHEEWGHCKCGEKILLKETYIHA